MKPEIQTRHDALHRHAMLLALLVTLAIVGGVALQPAVDRPPPADAPAEHPAIEPFAPSIDAPPACPNGRTNAMRTQIAGRVRWTDGSPAVGASVWSAPDGETAATCNAGRYTLPATPLAGISSGEIVLSVHPPCWSTPIERSVALRSADPGTFEVDDIVLPDEVDVSVDIKVTAGAAAQLATVGYGHIEYALHPTPSAGPLPATIGSARADLVPGLTQASLRVPYRPAIAASSRLVPMEEHR
ncbi:MAG: hypothetical protein KF830_17970, partial [Planctomycetes bacterium]|nr:hypothetical protein [Planctomycetota bacterium]